MKKFLGVALVLSVLMLICARPSAALGQEKPSPQGSQPPAGQQGQPSQSGQQAGQANKTPPAPQVTPEERQDFLAIQNELDPTRQLQLVEDFAKKHPTSPFLTDVYFFGIVASQQKGNLAKGVEYGEKSLQQNENNLRTLLIMSSILPQPQVAQGADKEKRLAEAETDANKALQIIAQAPNPQLPKQPNQTDEQFQKLKASLSNGAHAALGMVHLQRASEGLTGPDAGELAKAEQEYKTAVTSDNPNPEDYYRLGEAYSMEGKTDEAIEAFSKSSQLSQGTPLQAYADQRVQALKQKKAQAKPPEKP